MLGVVFAVWAILAVMYATIPVIYMPTSFRVWGLGALLFLALAGVVGPARHIGRRRRGAEGNETPPAGR